MKRFTKVLIANRGEIACRVIRTARSLGYSTVAVYSEADAQAPHVKLADQAVLIGAGPVAESYLCADKILQAARQSGADAVHPGYGFLSENAEFSRDCTDAGLRFIGPTPDAINAMGKKAEAKRLMIAAGVPCIPGYEGEDQSLDVLLAKAKEIGLPLMVKASAGGGGRGMRLVEQADDIANAIQLARSEAESAFGNGDLILERAIVKPRHVELQVFADSLGNTVHFAERDCSIQRRHQKVVEEAPCPVMTEELRARMGAAAVDAAQSINYVGAGTVEFLLDQSGEFFFLEMNTRLQVEHPVTEMITGLDLVALQLQVAQGDALGIAQEDVILNGHSIEVRLYTEDPAEGFLPTSGPVHLWAPAEGDGVRIDDGISTGQDISPFYDPMVAKIIAHGPDREVARQRLIGALKNTTLFGTTTNKNFLIECLEKPQFVKGLASTAFIAEEFPGARFPAIKASREQAAIAAVLAVLHDFQNSHSQALFVSPNLKNWASAEKLAIRKQYSVDDDTVLDCEVQPSAIAGASDSYDVSVSGAEETLRIDVLEQSAARYLVEVNGVRKQCRFLALNDAEHYLDVDGECLFFQDKVRLAGTNTGAAGDGQVVAPMHGMLLEIRVAAGDAVAKGDTVAILEAMKMHYEITAEVDGEITEVFAKAGTQVAADTVLIEIQADKA